MNPLILIVEDEPDLMAPLVFALRKEGFRTVSATTGAEGIKLARTERPDVLLLDWMLPDTSGTEVCRALRRDPLTEGLPIIMVTARSEEIDRVVGFEMGVDDYVAKPFSVRELALRVRALLRRAGTRVEVGPIFVDPDAGSAGVGDTLLSLTPIEFRLLRLLAEHPERVFSREDLIDLVWDAEASPASPRAVDSVVKRLRRKLGPAEAMLQAVRGTGYRLQP